MVEQMKKKCITRKIVAAVAILLTWMLVFPVVSAAQAVSLAGRWRFALDSMDVGVNEKWFNKDLVNHINLPGVLQSQGFGGEISIDTPWVLSLYDRYWYLRDDYKAYTRPGNVKVPFLCQPPRHYLGGAWYQRDVDIPKSWEGRRVVLTLERPHWETRIWLDDKWIGSNNSLVASHEFDLGVVTVGRHRLSVRVDNRMILPYRPDGHSVSDSLAYTWNGIVGKIEMSTTTPVWIDDAQMFPDVVRKSALIKVKIGNMTGRTGAATLSIGSTSVPVTWDAKGGKAEVEVMLGANAPLWDEFNPALQHITLRLRGESADDEREITFGLREFKTAGKEFVMNGRKTYLRGTHYGGDFPLTGYPATDVESWEKIIRICQSWGLNHMRFHSWCPPEAAFTAADELGFYLQPECGMWNSFTPGGPIARMLEEETERMVKAYGNHPSFIALSPSNEPAGNWMAVLPEWVNRWKEADPRRLYTRSTGRVKPGAGAPSQYEVSSAVRGTSGWFGGDFSQLTAKAGVPEMAHELGQWCAYPDYDIIKKFTGYMRPGNYEIFRDSMAAHGLLAKNKDFARASGRFQLECYKEEIEANLRTPGMGGFQLLDLHDYMGQGTALVGMLDVFWQEKGYASAKEFRAFCNSTVPLARLKQRVFTTVSAFDVDVEVAHYGAAPLANAVPYWKIMDTQGRTVAEGEWSAKTIPIGKNFALGKVTVDLAKLDAPAAYKLVVGIRGTGFENNWDFWLYPAKADGTSPTDILLTASWDEAEAKLAAGGKVLFMPRQADLDWFSPPVSTTPLFWNRLMNPGWAGTLGLWCDAKHPALAEFPTEANCDWQWTDILSSGARAMNLDRLPLSLQPIVQVVDDWNRNWKLGLIYECRVGPGRLMVSTVNLTAEPSSHPGITQLRRSLLAYMSRIRFQPEVSITAAEMRGLLFDSLIMRKLGATAHAASGSVANVIDGDPNTFWQPDGTPRRTPATPQLRQPQQIIVTFPAPVPMSGIVFMSRQNDGKRLGDIWGYTIEASDDGRQWNEVKRGELVSTWNPLQVLFSRTVTAKQLRFTALSGFGTDTTVALAELAVMYAGPKLADNGPGTIEYRRAHSTSSDVEEGPDISKTKAAGSSQENAPAAGPPDLKSQQH